MKVLHTSDWHLGARLGRHDRLADQQVALRGLLGIASQARPDLVLHTGDPGFRSSTRAWSCGSKL